MFNNVAIGVVASWLVFLAMGLNLGQGHYIVLYLATGTLGSWISIFFLPWFLLAVSPECFVSLLQQIAGS